LSFSRSGIWKQNLGLRQNYCRRCSHLRTQQWFFVQLGRPTGKTRQRQLFFNQLTIFSYVTSFSN
jgi:hypothetical protein